jgi:hypothetical protein
MSQGRERPRPDGLPLTLVAPALDSENNQRDVPQDTKLTRFRYERIRKNE